MKGTATGTMTEAAGKPASNRLALGPVEQKHRVMAFRAVGPQQPKTKTET